ncbi:MAG TPA: hypothetical protein DDY91_03180 [Planctomycetaceae bacterium]|nr:hypothetical protein [Planctomycetaceae bacterium]
MIAELPSSTKMSETPLPWAETASAVGVSWNSVSTEAFPFVPVRRHFRSARTADETRGWLDETDQLELASFTHQLLRLVRDNKPRAASDLIVDFFDDRFDQGRFALCDEALFRLSTRSLKPFSDTVLVALLAVTYPARERIPSRIDFSNRVSELMVDRHGEHEAAAILDSLR